MNISRLGVWLRPLLGTLIAARIAAGCEAQRSSDPPRVSQGANGAAVALSGAPEHPESADARPAPKLYMVPDSASKRRMQAEAMVRAAQEPGTDGDAPVQRMVGGKGKDARPVAAAGAGGAAIPSPEQALSRIKSESTEARPVRTVL